MFPVAADGGIIDTVGRFLDPWLFWNGTMTSAPEVLHAAMALGADERAQIAHQLLLSLEPDVVDDDVEQAWAEEIRRRRQAIREGRVALRDWDDVLSDIRQSIAESAHERAD